MNRKKIGEKLRKLRGKKTMGEVASALGIARSTLNMYELGMRIPEDEIKRSIAQYYNCSVEYIFFDEIDV